MNGRRKSIYPYSDLKIKVLKLHISKGQEIIIDSNNFGVHMIFRKIISKIDEFHFVLDFYFYLETISIEIYHYIKHKGSSLWETFLLIFRELLNFFTC